jgi:O-methyltransferase involved in polyketide biosynthesis
LYAQCRQFYRFPQPDILEIKDASSGTVEEFNRHQVEHAEGTNPVGDDGASNEAPSFERDPEEVAEWMENMGTAPTRNRAEDKARREREKARKERDKRRSDKEEREKEFANQKPIVLGANADANNLKNTDGLVTLAPKVASLS